MAFQRFTDVILTCDIPTAHLKAGDVGVIIACHDEAGLDLGYSVEFFDMIGYTVAIVTVTSSQIRLPTHSDRPAIRIQA
jgi:Domain of unknown function (DUF4926)